MPPLATALSMCCSGASLIEATGSLHCGVGTAADLNQYIAATIAVTSVNAEAAVTLALSMGISSHGGAAGMLGTSLQSRRGLDVEKRPQIQVQLVCDDFHEFVVALQAQRQRRLVGAQIDQQLGMGVQYFGVVVEDFFDAAEAVGQVVKAFCQARQHGHRTVKGLFQWRKAVGDEIVEVFVCEIGHGWKY